MSKKNKSDNIITRGAKILYFDIESTDLTASFGQTLMIGYKWAHEDYVYCPTITDYPGWKNINPLERDRQLLADFYEIFAEADVVVGHYASRFDLPFLNTRNLLLNGQPYPEVPLIDTWRIARRKLKMGSNRLEHLAELFQCESQKGGVPRQTWRLSKFHDEGALEELRDYCMTDVLTQEAVTDKLRPLAWDWPNMQLLESGEQRCCPKCGSTHIQKRGIRTLKSGQYDRYYCNDCGGWSRDRSQKSGLPKERNIAL